MRRDLRGAGLKRLCAHVTCLRKRFSASGGPARTMPAGAPYGASACCDDVEPRNLFRWPPDGPRLTAGVRPRPHHSRSSVASRGGRDIEDENDMQLVVLIARGVLDRIFQDQELVLLPIPVLEPDPVGAFSGKISSSWAARRVLVSPVWRDLRLWCQCRKHGVRAQAGGRRHLVALEREGLEAPGSAPGVSVGRMGWKSRPRRSGVYPGLRKPDGNAVTGRLSCWAMPLTLIIPLGKGRPTPLRTVRMIA